MNKRISILSLLAITFISWAFGQAVATLQEKELLMGNTTQLEIEVPLPNDTSKVEFPILKEALLQHRHHISFLNDTIEMRVDHKKTLDVKGDNYYMLYAMTVQAFDSGSYQLPSMEFIVDGEKITSNPVSLTVLPVKVKADDKIDDFTGVANPFGLNPNPEEMEEEGADSVIWWLIVGAVAVLLAMLAYVLYRKNGTIFPLPRKNPPYKVAIEKLLALQKQNLPQRGRTKDYYTRLTEILRVYLKKQFGIKTFEKTSSEILVQVEANAQLEPYASILKSIFETANFVKFAKVNPSETENSRCLTDSIRFIEASHPEEEDVKNEPEGKSKRKEAKR